MSDPVLLKSLLQKTIRTFNLERQVNAAQVCHYFRKWAEGTWVQGAGEQSAALSAAPEPKSYTNGVLWVRVKDSVWAHQVQLKQNGFVEYLKGVCPEVALKSVRTVVEPFAESA